MYVLHEGCPDSQKKNCKKESLSWNSYISFLLQNCKSFKISFLKRKSLLSIKEDNLIAMVVERVFFFFLTQIN